MTPRTPVPDEFQDTEPKATERQVNYIRDLLDHRDLMAQPKWFDDHQAMSPEEYAELIERIKAGAAALTKKEASKWLDWLTKLPYKTRKQTQVDLGLPTEEELPNGRYAVEAESGELRFYHFNRRWKRLMYVQHGPDSSAVEGRAIKSILDKIIAAGPYEAAVRYGREIGHCAICGTRLTNTISRELGIGPVCGRRFWSDDPDHWKSTKKAARQAILNRGEDPSTPID